MSQRDRDLLLAAGLTKQDASRIFDRTRQAVYTGLAHERDYFSSAEVLQIVMETRRQQDTARIDALNQFIEQAYPELSRHILPDRIAEDHVESALATSDIILVLTNGNPDHFKSNAVFARLFRGLFTNPGNRVYLIVPGDWVIGLMQQHGKLPMPRHTIALDEALYSPSFFITRRKNSARAFVFSRLSVEELPLTDAERLWEHFWPKCEENAHSTLRVAG